MDVKRSGLLVMVIGAAAIIAWLSWAWSPTVEEPVAVEVAEVPVNSALPHAAPIAPAPQPVVQAPIEPEPEPEPEPESVQKPERIPTPHPMSLDQSKPPEQYGELARLKKQYESESRSGESSTNEAKLRQMISTPNIPKALVQEITCRRNLCKLDVQWEPRRRIGYSVLLESFKQLYSKRVAVEPAPERSADGTYASTMYVRLNP